MKNKIVSQNREWGFFGTTQRNYNFSDEATERLYSETGLMMRDELDVSKEQVREFLDSTYGRHFSDELSFYGAQEGISERQFVAIVKKYFTQNFRNHPLLKIGRRVKKHWIIKEFRK